MKTLYEGMFILPKALSEEALEEALGRIRGEIEKLGGAVKNTTRLGKRPFARPMGKQDAGHYVVINFELEGDQIAPLQARLKLNDDVFRVQFTRTNEKAAAAASTGAGEEKAE